MKSSLTFQILEHLIFCGSSLILSSLFVPYGQSLGRTIRELEEIAATCPHDFSPRSKDTISVALSRLKRRGFVIGKGPKKKTVWRISAMGRRHFKKAERAGSSLPSEDGKIRLVLFDIPEEKRGQRDWLRIRLSSCDYAPLQKSVWIGTRPLPQKVEEELKERGLVSYVHIVGLEGIVPERRVK